MTCKTSQMSIYSSICPSVQSMRCQHFQNPDALRALGGRRWNLACIVYGSGDTTSRKQSFECWPPRRAGPPRTEPGWDRLLTPNWAAYLLKYLPLQRWQCGESGRTSSLQPSQNRPLQRWQCGESGRTSGLQPSQNRPLQRWQCGESGRTSDLQPSQNRPLEADQLAQWNVKMAVKITMCISSSKWHIMWNKFFKIMYHHMPADYYNLH